MAARRADPRSAWRVMPHRANGYVYAATCETIVREDGSRTRRYTHWGRLEEGDRFVPNLRFLTLPPAERQQLTFPAGWDLSEIDTGSEDVPVGADLAEPTTFENKLYGDVWLLLRIAEARGVTEDLTTVIRESPEVASDILTLAIFRCLTGWSLSRLPRWQRSVKVPAAEPLTPSRVTRLCQHIRHEQVMEFFRLRIARQSEDSFVACDSTTRSAWGTHVAELRSGRSIDDHDRAHEVVVYSLATYEPVYHRSFPHDMPDARMVRTIVADLKALGVEGLTVVYDRDCESADDIAAFLAAKLPFLVRAKTAREPVVSLLLALEWDSEGFPKGMAYDEGEHLWHAQLPIPDTEWSDADGTVCEVADGDLVCNVYLDMRERVSQLTRLNAVIAKERAALEAMTAEEALSRRGEINKGLRYHRARFSRAGGRGGTWSYDGFEEVPDKVARAKATCGFFASIAHGLPGDAMDHARVCLTRDEQEQYFEQAIDQMGSDTRGWPTHDGTTGRLFCAFVGFLLSSVVRSTWRASAGLMEEFPTALDVLDEMHDIRWCGHPDGTSHMTTFLASQVRVCEAFGIAVPPECLPNSEHGTSDVRARRESSRTLGRNAGRPARNKVGGER